MSGSPILPQQFRPASDQSGDRVSDIDERRVHDRVGRWSRVKMSALGQKRTCAAHKLMSALPPIATSNATYGDVRFGPKADIAWRCPQVLPEDVRHTAVLRVDCGGWPRSHGFLIEYPHKRGCYRMIGPRVLAGNELAIDDNVGLEVDFGCGHLAACSRERLRHVEVHLRVKYVVLDPLLFRG